MSKQIRGETVLANNSRIRKFHVQNALLPVAFIALAFNLRAPLTSLPSVIADIRTYLHISSGIAGLLTTIPVFCFGALSPLASGILARVSVERAIFITLGGVIIGSLLRSAGGLAPALLGTILLGAALTLGNIVSLMVIARDFYRHSGLMTGVYVMAMSMGAMLTSALTAPLALIIGWRLALAGWSCLALLAVVLWVGVARQNRAKAASSAPFARARRETSLLAAQQIRTAAPVIRPVWRRRQVWLLAVAFASHTFIFYGLTAWLPDYLVQIAGMTVTRAGAAASLFQILGILGCFGLPWLGSSTHWSPATLFLIVAASWFIMPAGLLMAPALWLLWTMFGGIGSGGGFAVVFMLVMAQAGNLDENRKISSFVQGIGYIVASTSPTFVGSLHQATGGWRVGFILLALIAVVMAACGFRAAGPVSKR